MQTLIRALLTCGAAALFAASCTMKDQQAPPLTGPSEFGTSVSVQVTPDVLNLDGASQAAVTVTVRDVGGQPVRNLPLRADILSGGQVVDFGSLSARTLVTGSDGRASAIYTAPLSNAESEALVQIAISPLGTNFDNAVARTATIRLVPPGIRVPPSDLQPAFTVSTDSPTQSQSVLFDAQTSRGSIAEYRWDFGDGATGSGRTASHAYSKAGTYHARLTLVDGLGRSASTTRTINVAQGAAPTANAVFSPTSPLPGQAVNFSALGSTPAAGRSIARYDWSFGDGTSGSGAQVSHVYASAGTYIVTLLVTDDIGRTATTTVSVTVGAATPVAVFTFSPTQPAAGQQVFFNGGSSTAPAGRSLSAYTWDFGDGSVGHGAQLNHAFAQAGTYTVRLTVTDSSGVSASQSTSVTVGSGQPTADFTFSPTDPGTGQTVFFDASASRGATGRSIVSYQWSFGDGTTGAGQTFSKIGGYATANTFSVILTVTDDRGVTGTVTKTVQVR